MAPGPPAGHAAFSLIELLIVLVILGALAGMALPRYAEANVRYGLDAAAKRVAADVEYVATRTRATQTPQLIRFVPSSDLYWLPDMADMDHPDQVYAVTLSAEPYRTALSSTSFTNNALTFDAYGEPSEAGQVVLTRGIYQRVIAVDAHGGVTLP
ncbi:MAG: prepilin-type N-terminal cleavage/methylation domain-containing protein [Planctomycetota bacterium]